MAKLLTSKEVCKILKIHQSQLSNWTSKGKVIPTQKGGRGPTNGSLYSVKLVTKIQKFLEQTKALKKLVLHD